MNAFDAILAGVHPGKPKPSAPAQSTGPVIQPSEVSQGLVIYDELEQGTEAWFEARRGILTASEMKLFVTAKTLKEASNDKARAHLFELLAQRVSGFVEPHYVGDDILRGWEDEEEMRRLYAERIAPVRQVGFITNDKWGFKLGYSPDGLVGDDGLIEGKSRRQKFHLQCMIENVGPQTIPDDFLVQCQTGLLVSERKWLDFMLYCGGLPFILIRTYPDPKVQDVIVDVAAKVEKQLREREAEYRQLLTSDARLIPTERREPEQEMHLG